MPPLHQNHQISSPHWLHLRSRIFRLKSERCFSTCVFCNVFGNLCLLLWTITLVLQMISWVRAPSLFDIWSDLLREFMVYGEFASSFFPFKSKNRERDWRVIMEAVSVGILFSLPRSKWGPLSHSLTASPFSFGLCMSSFSCKALNTWQVRDWRDEVGFWSGRGWGTGWLPPWNIFIHSLYSRNTFGASIPGQDLDWVLGTQWMGDWVKPLFSQSLLPVGWGIQAVEQAMTVHHDKWDNSGS